MKLKKKTKTMKLRNKLELSQMKFSELTGIPIKHIINLENNKATETKQNLVLYKVFNFLHDNNILSRFLDTKQDND